MVRWGSKLGILLPHVALPACHKLVTAPRRELPTALLPSPQFVNNIVRDIDGAGFGVWGCYDCLYGEDRYLAAGGPLAV